MDKIAPGKKTNWEKTSLIALLVFGIVFFFLLIFNLFNQNDQKSQHLTHSDLINTKEIATLSVSEFVYNGIARTYLEDGNHDYNVLYKSTVKVGIDADKIDYAVDEENKIIKFILPDFEIQRPVIDESSITVIPDRPNMFTDELIKLCRSDALEKAQKSEKFISCARENLKTIMEAWYAPAFEGYTFKYQFKTAEGGDAE